MQQVVRELQKFTSWKESMRKSCRSNKLNIDIASYFTPLRFRGVYSRFENIYDKKGQRKQERWIQNELKAFYWICVAISCITEVKIASFTDKEFQTLAAIFYFKLPITIQYQIKKLNDQSEYKHDWQIQQQQLLKEIVKKYQGEPFKWNQYARQLYQLSNKVYFRTGKQCRERWLNHLDPEKQHGEWTIEEDKKFIELYLSDGRKWSQIARKLGNKRTEHMVKNRYKAILTRQKKAHPQIKSQEILIKSLLNVNITQGYYQKHRQSRVTEIEKKIKIQIKGISTKIAEQSVQQQIDGEQNSENEQQVHVPQIQQKNNNIQKIITEERQKNIPVTSSAYEVSQVYSPWMFFNPHIPTPSFSPSVPFFINLSSFSAFEAFSSNQFCNINSRTNTDKLEHS